MVLHHVLYHYSKISMACSVAVLSQVFLYYCACLTTFTTMEAGICLIVPDGRHIVNNIPMCIDVMLSYFTYLYI